MHHRLNRRRAGATPTFVRGLLLVASGALAACGPVKSTSVLVNAAAEVAAARTAGADKGAPFEFRAAEAYLAKAREEQGHAEFEVAIALAQRSKACAKAAVARLSGDTVPADPRSEPKPDDRCRPSRHVPVIDRKAHPGLRFQPQNPEPDESPAQSAPQGDSAGGESTPKTDSKDESTTGSSGGESPSNAPRPNPDSPSTESKPSGDPDPKSDQEPKPSPVSDEEDPS